MLSGLLGRKVGMTQVFGADGTAVPVTVIEAGPCTVTQVFLSSLIEPHFMLAQFSDGKGSSAYSLRFCGHAEARLKMQKGVNDDETDLALFHTGVRIGSSANSAMILVPRPFWDCTCNLPPIFLGRVSMLGSP
jgi:hypothetical protein